MKLLDQKGFSPVIVVLILILLTLVGGIGYHVWLTNSKAGQTITTSQAPTPTPDVEELSEEEDLTAEWVAYSNAEGKFSLKHPKDWVRASNPELCAPGLLLLGADSKSVGKCATDSGSQMAVSSQAGDNHADYKLSASDYPDVKSEAVTVQGVAGTKQTGTYKMPADAMGPGPKDGEKRVQYVFYTDGRTYVVSLSILPEYPDVQQEFETMVTKTLVFKP